ncbi:MAG TPA: methionine adenosyltransferase [Pirellulales bacterium]|nr:methionine adenosyltransferase [Pirellulales bacterium]
MQNILIGPIRARLPDAEPVEIVERKGLGHPDTICDALAEELSVALSKFYLEHFGLILHHNVDKALLCGGAARAAFGGGEVIEPFDLYLSGRVTEQFKSVRVPIDELARSTCFEWLRKHFHALDPEKHVRLHVHTRPGSSDLVDLYSRQRQAGCWLANDTSCGAGYAPLSKLEQTVLAIERRLNAPEFKKARPEVGEDIKVLGVGTPEGVELTVACAFVDRYVSELDDYVAKKSELAADVRRIAEETFGPPIDVSLNAADDAAAGNVFLTVTGTSAEAGDDGEVGRGNRANGLITPCRPMTMEATAGKNPVTHVGKLYNVAAAQIAHELVKQVPGVAFAECYLVSAIGSPVNQPRLVDVRVSMRESAPIEPARPEIDALVGDLLAGIDTLWQRIVDRQISLF